MIQGLNLCLVCLLQWQADSFPYTIHRPQEKHSIICHQADGDTEQQPGHLLKAEKILAKVELLWYCRLCPFEPKH